MIIFEKPMVNGWMAAIRGLRNPMNSWEKSDSIFKIDDGPVAIDILGRPIELSGDIKWRSLGLEKVVIGLQDFDLMYRMARAGSDEAKYRRMINVTVDITAPLYWWKEFDTYKVGTVANSCSTMHKIAAKEFELSDFSHEHLYSEELECLENTIKTMNGARQLYLDSKKKEDWWQMIQLLPSSYNQKRTVQLNYEVLAGIYPKRKNHKLDEWHHFAAFIRALPYSELITLEECYQANDINDIITEIMTQGKS